MRIINSVLGDATGGRWQVVCDYSRVLSGRGHSVLLLVSRNHPPDLEQIPPGVAVEIVRNRGHYDYVAALSVARRLRQFVPDLAIAHCSRSVALLKRAMRGVTPVVAVSHSHRIRRLLPADAYVALTANIAQSLKQAGREATGKPCFIVPNMIAVAESGLPPYRPRRRQLRIGALGRFDAAKGFDVFLEALALLRNGGPAFEAVLGGCGPEQQHLRKRAQQLGLGDRLSFPGWIKRIDNFFANLDMLVVPARLDAFGLTPLQAAVAGVPQLLSTASGHLEMFESESEVLFSEVGNPDMAAKQIMRLMTEPGLAARLRRAAYERVVRDYSDTVVTEKLLHAFASIKKNSVSYDRP